MRSVRSLVRAAYRFRDAALIAEKKKISAAPFRIFIGRWSEWKSYWTLVKSS
jgi:hypothetical protein